MLCLINNAIGTASFALRMLQSTVLARNGGYRTGADFRSPSWQYALLSFQPRQTAQGLEGLVGAFQVFDNRGYKVPGQMQRSSAINPGLRIFCITNMMNNENRKTNHLDVLSADLELAIEAARRGGAVISGNFTTTGDALVKPDGKGLVTETDKATERVIINILQANSAYAIISEETAPDEPPPGRSWIVDPLDGTTNFARKLPLFAVSIALLQDQDVVLGVIFNPMTEECFYAEKGKGAYLNGQPIKVSSKTDASTTVLFLDHGYQTDHRKRCALVADRFAHRYSVRALGTTALELAYLARGCAGGFICSGDEFWDYAAGIVLIEEAGGKVTDWKGNPWDRRNAFILASNGSFHQELVAEVAELQP